MHPFLQAFIGGTFIGLSATMLLLFKGRIFGISGLVGGALFNEDRLWRIVILLGLVTAGFIAQAFLPESLVIGLERSPLTLIVAGLLVGFGTQMGGGCTSGHGVCGISRLSLRSIIATVTFMAAGIFTTYLFYLVGGN